MNDYCIQTLVQVGKSMEETTLGNLVCRDDGRDESEELKGYTWDFGVDFLYTLKENGLVQDTYTYLAPSWAMYYEDAPVGWYTEEVAQEGSFSEDNCQNAVPLDFRTGFKVNAGSDEMSFTGAGEVVPKGWIEVTLKGNAYNDYTGNFTPVRIDIGDIVCRDDGRDESEELKGYTWDFGVDFLYTLKENGLVQDTYTYLAPSWAMYYEDAPVGWYTEEVAQEGSFSEDNCQNTKVHFDPGEEFKVNAGSEEMSIYIPSALGVDTVSPF